MKEDIVWRRERSLWQFAQDGGAGLSRIHTYRFREPVRLSGFILPRWWDSTGNPRYLRSLRLLVISPDSQEWTEVWRNEDLPAQAPNTIQFPSVPALAARLEAWRIHPPARMARAFSLREDTVESPVIIDGNPSYEALSWITEPLEGVAVTSVPSPWGPWQPAMKMSIDSTSPVSGVVVSRVGDSVVMDNGWLRIGCSLERPRLTHLGWDSLGTGRQADNLLSTEAYPGSSMPHWPHGNGPYFATHLERVVPSRIGGDGIQVQGSRVSWNKIQVAQGVVLDAVFALDATGLDIELTLNVARELTALDAEVWRLVWNLRQAMVSHLAPIYQPFMNGRRGRCQFPAILHAPNYGNVRIDMKAGGTGPAFLVVDSHQQRGASWSCCGIELGVEPLSNGDVRLSRGVHRAWLRLERCEIAPAGAADLPIVRRAWAGGFAFNPQQVGMACTSTSDLAWFQIHQNADHARATDGSSGEMMRALTRYTVELGLREAPGYGAMTWGFADSAPSLAIAACVLAENAPVGWTESIWPRLREMGRCIRESQREGIATHTAHTGNLGERCWSTNWWDVLCFGHQDAYGNALAWRGLNLLARVAARLGDKEEAQACADAAAHLKRAYWPTFRHPQSGVVSGWRSADGELHDYSFLFVNGIAVVYGLVPENEVPGLVSRLEEERENAGYTSTRFGLPGNLRAIPAAACAPNHYNEDLFGRFQNGGVTACFAYHWMRALGLAKVAELRHYEDDLLTGFEERCFGCGADMNSEFRCRDGTPSGDVGMLTDQFNVLLAILQNRGLAQPLLLG